MRPQFKDEQTFMDKMSIKVRAVLLGQW